MNLSNYFQIFPGRFLDCSQRFFLKSFLIPLLLAAQIALPLQAAAMTIGEERDIGEQLLYAVRSEFRLIDDPDISQYINELGYKVLAVAGPQYFDYHFFIVKSDQFNAFAAPGGLVFFYTGLIETMKTEDELLSVLAHEIGHVVSRHIAQRIDKSGKINAVAMAIGLASLALGIPALSQGLLTGSLAAGQALNLQYSRTDEEQADRLSFDWMIAMSRNPAAMVEMLRTMRRITRYRSDKLPQYLLTHPNPEARLSYVQSLIELDTNDPSFYGKVDNFKFLRFKYRTMFHTMEPEKLRIYCANTLSSAKSVEQQIMARYGLALLDTGEHNYDEAQRNLNSVREHYPDRDILKVDAAMMMLMEEGRLDEAIVLLQEVEKRDPTDMYAVFQLGRAMQKKGRYDTAKKLFARVAGVMPEYSKLYYELGRIEADRGEQEISRFYLGKYYLFEGKMKYAKQYLKSAAKNPSVPEEYRNEAAAILARLKKLEDK